MKLTCISCRKEFDSGKVRYFCDCGDLLEAAHDIGWLKERITRKLLDKRLSDNPFGSGVWRYKELIFPDIGESKIVTKNEGNTRMYSSRTINDFTGCENLLMKHEGENPTGSFKDRGMTVGISAAKFFGFNKVACASTGNTSASMACYASYAGIESKVFIPEGKISTGKLAQTMAYGAGITRVKGNFDDALRQVINMPAESGHYLLNSINPFRIEGQKSICFEALQQLKWKAPDWFVLPGGNLGNASALGKALKELYNIGIINRIPRIAVIQAHGANPFYRMWKNDSAFRPVENPETIATAIRIGNPASWKKALDAVKWSRGVVEEVTDEEIIGASIAVNKSGIGAEPASCATIAGAKKLSEKGIIKKDETAVGILTGHMLKDTDFIIKYFSGKSKNGKV